jgi:hypothetical protein
MRFSDCARSTDGCEGIRRVLKPLGTSPKCPRREQKWTTVGPRLSRSAKDAATLSCSGHGT